MTTAGAYLPWEGEVTNVLKISKKLDGIRLPEVLFGGASGHEIMRRTLSITHKFASGGPSSGGDGGWSQTGEHEWEVTAYEPFPSDIDQSLDPSFAGDDTLYPWNPLVKTRRLSDDEVEALRQNVKAALDANHGACATYVAKLLAKTNELSPNGEDGALKKSNFVLRNADVMGIFGIVKDQGGFYYAYGDTTNGFKDKPEFGGARVWLFGGNDIDPQTRDTPVFATPFGARLSEALDSLVASTTIHELLHYNFTDSQLAKATAALNEDANPDFSGPYGMSNYWNNQLRLHCDPHYVSAPPKK